MKKLFVIAFVALSSSVYAQSDTTVTSIERGELAAIKVYPNPFKESVSIKCPATMQFKSLDAFGREVDLDDASRGLYFVVFSKGRERHTVRVIKN